MGTLTRRLQDGFQDHCPAGWTFRPEAPLVDPAGARRLGFDARADGLFEQADTGRRLWVEFEVARADPVANHAKFATARHLEPWPGEESFVSMASRAIEPGRYALAAGAAMLMRGFGVAAFQTSLLPSLDGHAIQALNRQPSRARVAGERRSALDIPAEVARALRVGDPVAAQGRHRIHCADNVLSVNANVRQWNADIAQPSIAATWGTRRVGYFVRDSATGLFAPVKFCAFVPAPCRPQHGWLQAGAPSSLSAMTITLYATLGEGDPRFDGHVAWQHLCRHLGYTRVPLDDSGPSLCREHAAWLQACGGSIALRTPAWMLVPPLELRGIRRR
jgi:hypothetical protein